MPYEIHRALVLSTLHITPATLTQFHQWPHIGDHEFGAYFSVPHDEGHEGLDCPPDQT